jgi:hypothetical protein
MFGYAMDPTACDATVASRAEALRYPEIVIVLKPPFSRELGRCWLAHLAGLEQTAMLDAMSDTEAYPGRSKASLYEDGTSLGPAHALHEAIRSLGRGSFSHWKHTLYFSTSDGTDPNTNGRNYRLVVPTGRRPDTSIPDIPNR